VSDIRVSDIGKFGLLSRIARLLPSARDDTLVGVGDDVAVARPLAANYLLLTSDALVEGVHFLKDRIGAQELGWKLVAINVSDIASMDGEPRHLLLSLALPPDTDVAWVESLYAGVRDAAEGYSLDVAGGNTSRCPERIVLDVFLLGEVEPELLVRRSGARPGDALCVTGHLGDAAAGLALLLEPSLTIAPEHTAVVSAAHLTPVARLREGRVIAAQGATAMIDISDGLASDVGHLATSSGVGACIGADRIPISDAALAVAGAAGPDALEWALSGGEDYELLFALPPDGVAELAGAVRSATGTPVSVIGEARRLEEGVVLVRDGVATPLSAGGWDHFRR